jgi:hypothetical protein
MPLFTHSYSCQRFAVVLIMCLFFSSVAPAQVWQWGRSPVVGGGTTAFFLRTAVTSKGHTLALEGFGNKGIFWMFDEFGGLQWKRILTGASSAEAVSMQEFALDGQDNIYILSRPILKVDSTTIGTPEPYALTKLSPLGRFIWSKQITMDENAGLSRKLEVQGDQVFFTVETDTEISYEGVTYASNNSYRGASFVFALDTAGHTKWVKRVYVPASNLCGSTGTFPINLSINKHKQVLFTCVASSVRQLYVDNELVIDSPVCKTEIFFASVLDGLTGNVVWARIVPFDTLAVTPNSYSGTINFPNQGGLLLDNGYAAFFTSGKRDTLNAPRTTVSAYSQSCLLDASGQTVQVSSLGALNNNLYAITYLAKDSSNNIYSAGSVYPTSNDLTNFTGIFELRKHNALFEPTWKKQILYSGPQPATRVQSFSYRQRGGAVIVDANSASGSSKLLLGNEGFIIPVTPRYLLARIADSVNVMSGYVYFDLNKNNVYEPDEPAGANMAISSTSGDTLYTFTDRQGWFFIQLPGLGTHTFTVRKPNGEYSLFSVSPDSYSTHFGNYGNFATQHFAFQPTHSVTDGKLSITYYGIPRPNGLIATKVVINNAGTTPISGSYQVSKATNKLSYVQSAVAPSTVQADTLTYNFSLPAMAETTNLINWKVSQTAVLTDTFVIRARLQSSIAGELPGNNQDSTFIPVRTSYDPNDKQVFPFTAVNHDSALVQKEYLEYVIRFQNTGNDTAFTIAIKDTLAPKLDLNTFQPISVSHPMQIQWEYPRTAIFYFPNILLPDSTTNEPRSHGYVRFRIKPVAGVTLTDSIYNKAAIYFDYNAPVITNTVRSTFAKRAPVVTSIGDIANLSKNMTLYPNPVKEELICKIVKHQPGEVLTVSLFNIQGSQVLQQVKKVTGPETLISLPASGLVPGIYVLQAIGKSGQYIKLFIKE